MKIPKINEFSLEDSTLSERIIEDAFFSAESLVACGGEGIPLVVDEIRSGRKFVIPILIPEGVWSGDNRIFTEKSITKKDGKLELLWQIATDNGHKGSVLIGRIDSIERLEDSMEEDSFAPKYGWGNARGVFDTGPYAREAERLVAGGYLTGVSADMDKFEASLEATDGEEDKERLIKSEKITVTAARLIAATLVAKPAFQEAQIYIDYANEYSELELPIEDGMYAEELEDDFPVLDVLAASAAPIIPPRQWFSNPTLKEPTPITVTDDGRVFGHIAAWNVSHIGMPRATKPPRSASNYAYFRTGVLRTEDGSDVPVGQLTLAGGHAPLNASAAQALKHYDDTSSAIADVSAGEDQHGIWVAGALRPEATPQQVRALRASAPSGDWRTINGRLELVAVCQVNVPGFPVARSIVAGGHMMALVAAGARPLAEIRAHSIEDRVRILESREFSSQIQTLDTVFEKLTKQEEKALIASISVSDKILTALETTSLTQKMARLEKTFESLQ